MHIDAEPYTHWGLDVELAKITMVYFDVKTALLAGGLPMDLISRSNLDLMFSCTVHEMQTRCILTLHLTHPGDWMWS